MSFIGVESIMYVPPFMLSMILWCSRFFGTLSFCFAFRKHTLYMELCSFLFTYLFLHLFIGYSKS